MKKFLKFDSTHITKIVSIFEKNNVKLSFEKFGHLQAVMHDLSEFFSKIKANDYIENVTNIMCTFNCNLQKIESVTKIYKYMNLVFLPNKNTHLSNMENIKQICDVYSNFHHSPYMLDRMFGTIYKDNEKYIDGHYYDVMPVNMCVLKPKSMTVNKKLCQKWNDYLNYYIDNAKLCYLDAVSCTSLNEINSFFYGVYIQDFLSNYPKEYINIDNLINFLIEENLNNACFFELSSASDQYFRFNLTPFKNENDDGDSFHEKICVYIDKLIKFGLFTHNQKFGLLKNLDLKKYHSVCFSFQWNAVREMNTYCYVHSSGSGA